VYFIARCLNKEEEKKDAGTSKGEIIIFFFSINCLLLYSIGIISRNFPQSLSTWMALFKGDSRTVENGCWRSTLCKEFALSS